MCPNEFVRIGSGIFATLGLLGVIHVLGPTEADSIFGNSLWLDWSEAIFFLLLGLALFLLLTAPAFVRRRVTIWMSWILFLFSVWGVFFDRFLTVHIEQPLEPAFFFLMAVSAHVSGLCAERGEELVL